MAFKLMMDHNVHGAIVRGLRLRGVDVLTAEEDGSHTLLDDRLLQRATELRRVLFSQDSDLIREARLLQGRKEFFTGVIYAHQLHVTIGVAIRDLTDLANHLEPEDVAETLAFFLFEKKGGSGTHAR